MYRAVVFGLFVTNALANKDMVENACNKFGPNLTRCCNNMPQWPPSEPEFEETAIMECNEKEKLSSDSNCYIEECFAKLGGYYGSDGKLDKDGFANYIKKTLENDMDFFNVIKEKCLNKDLSKFGSPEMCDFIKIEICFHTFLFVEKCAEWSDEGECRGIKEIMQACKAE